MIVLKICVIVVSHFRITKGVSMEISFTEHKPEYGIIGLKMAQFIERVKDNKDEHYWVSKLTCKQGLHIGYFCTFSTDEFEYHLQNDKGTVRVFKNAESAAKIYSDIVFSDGSAITHVCLGLV